MNIEEVFKQAMQATGIETDVSILADGNLHRFHVAGDRSGSKNGLYIFAYGYSPNRITAMFLDQAEFRAQRRQDIHMRDWEAFLDKFLRDTELPVLIGPGAVSHDDALDWAQG